MKKEGSAIGAVDLLSRLRRTGVTVWADGDRLRFSAARGALSADLRAELAERKDELLGFLRRAAAQRTQVPAITPVPRDRPLPLSSPQWRMWFFEQMWPGTSTYHMAASWRMRGGLDVAALDRAFAAIVRRHEALRTRFVLDADGPVQLAVADAAAGLPVIDLAALPRAERDLEIRRLMAAEHRKPFDLACPPLIRVSLLHLDADDHVLMLTMHHIAGDMWSAGIVLRELAELYDCPGAGLPEPALQYADFAAWQRTWLGEDALRDQLEYWRQRLAGAPSFLELPTDRPRPQMSSNLGGQRSMLLPASLVADLDDLCRRRGLTRFMVLLAAFDVLLSRWSGETDILVGSPVANRTRPEVEGIVGFFANTLVLRADLTGEPTVAELLDRVRDSTLDAFERPDLPVEQLVEELRPLRSPGRPPLFQVMFVLQNAPMSPMSLPGLTVETLPDRRVATEFDLTLEISAYDAVAQASLHYNADIFDPETADRMLASWRRLLEAMLADQDRPVSSLPLLPQADLDALAYERSATGLEYPPMRVHDLATRQAALTPDVIGVAFRDREVSYAELETNGVSIGRPIANTSAYILDDCLNPLPAGVPGQLYIGGHGVARGYLNRPALTAERFAPSPFTEVTRLYRTGDRARFLRDGRIEFLGHINRQVMLGGHRIELGEIESALREHPAIRQAAVMLRADAAGHVSLVAYLVGAGARPSLAELRAWLAPKMSEVASPAVLVWLDDLPLDPGGKVDYWALSEPDATTGARSERAAMTSHAYVAPRDDVEQTIARIRAAVPVVVSSTFTANPVQDALKFWADRLDLPMTVRFAPYGQVFQQVLDPASATAGNQHGVNVALLRMEDWSGGDESPTKLGDEFARALAAFQRSRDTPMVVMLCPPTEENRQRGARWRCHMATAVAGIPQVACLDTVPMLEVYDLEEYNDPVSFEAGHIPYTQEFFAVLGTVLARQVSALLSDYPEVFLVDGDQFRWGLDGTAARVLSDAIGALARQGRRVYLLSDRPLESSAWLDPAVTVWTDNRLLTAKVADAVRDCGREPHECAYLSSDENACAAAAEGHPDLVVLRHPSGEAELTSFLTHTWLCDPPGRTTPSTPWWRETPG